MEDGSATNIATKEKAGPKPKAKPGPKPKAKPSAADCNCKELAARLDNMEQCLSKMAHFTGTNRVLDEFGIDRWEVTKESMRKVKG